MLLYEFVDALARDNPELHSTLEVQDFTRFTTLAAEVTARGFVLKDRLVVPFLKTALNITIPTNLLCRLWHLISPTLPQLRVQPAQLIQEHGYRSELPIQIPEYLLKAPTNHCLVCPAKFKLHHRSRINGYLYDLDGVHTTGIITLKCPSWSPSHPDA